MATYDERRRLAANMCVFDVVGDGRGRYWLNGTLFGMDISARSEEGLRDGMAHLASFIEPDAIPDNPDETGRPLSEPEIDREPLLALADEMVSFRSPYCAECDVRKACDESSHECVTLWVREYGKRIREAVGA